MIVVDNTVLADLFLGEGSLKESAEALVLEDFDWISVGLWRYEFGNVLWKILRKSDDLEHCNETAEAAFEAAEAALLESVELLEFTKVFELAIESGLTFYDASYVWLARERGLKLRTRDKEILREFPDIAVKMPA